MNIGNALGRVPFAKLQKNDLQRAGAAENSHTAQQGTGCIDPLTGGFITTEEFNTKYNGGKKLLYVAQDGGGYAAMTASAYIQKYGNSTNPPKAYEEIPQSGINTPEQPSHPDGKLPFATLKKDDDFSFPDINSANTVQANKDPGCVDPLTGKIITVEQFNKKYNGGKTFVYVRQENGDYQKMTASEYVQYGNSADPPKAYLQILQKPSNYKTW